MRARSRRSTSRPAGSISTLDTISSAARGSSGSSPSGFPAAASTSRGRASPNDASRPGIAEVPLELHADDFHLQGTGGRADKALVGPQALGGDGQPDEQGADDHQWQGFRDPDAGRAPGALAQHRSEKEKVRGEEERERCAEPDRQQPVERRAVHRAVCRHGP